MSNIEFVMLLVVFVLAVWMFQRRPPFRLPGDRQWRE